MHYFQNDFIEKHFILFFIINEMSEEYRFIKIKII